MASIMTRTHHTNTLNSSSSRAKKMSFGLGGDNTKAIKGTCTKGEGERPKRALPTNPRTVPAILSTKKSPGLGGLRTKTTKAVEAKDVEGEKSKKALTDTKIVLKKKEFLTSKRSPVLCRLSTMTIKGVGEKLKKESEERELMAKKMSPRGLKTKAIRSVGAKEEGEKVLAEGLKTKAITSVASKEDGEKVLAEGKSDTRMISSMVLLMIINKEQGEEISRLKISLQEKNNEVEKLMDLCSNQMEEIKSLKDLTSLQLQELKHTNELIPNLQMQVASLEEKLQSLAADVVEVSGNKSNPLSGCSSDDNKTNHVQVKDMNTTLQPPEKVDGQLGGLEILDSESYESGLRQPIVAIKTSGLKKKGSVKWFNYHKGFGVITPDDGTQDLFVHQSAIKTDGFRSLAQGEPVEFFVEIGENGRGMAANVTGPDGGSVQGNGRVGGGPYGGRGGGGSYGGRGGSGYGGRRGGVGGGYGGARTHAGHQAEKEHAVEVGDNGRTKANNVTDPNSGSVRGNGGRGGGYNGGYNCGGRGCGGSYDGRGGSGYGGRRGGVGGGYGGMYGRGGGGPEKNLIFLKTMKRLQF